MSTTDYEKAYKLGKKDYQYRLMGGMKPTLQVLDDILPPKGSYSEVPLGLVKIPTDQIVGTKTAARSTAFAGNFMPILKQGTEFAEKWENLSTSHVVEGIREPIKAYEYLNKFYVEEGNKRVSVMKFFDVSEVPGMVTRILPKRTQEKENKIYFEFLEFYEATKINYIWFSEEGCFLKLLKLVGKQPGERWTEDECIDFRSIYTRFKLQYQKWEEDIPITVGDAFLKFVTLHGYEAICKLTMKELTELMEKTREEFQLIGLIETIDLKMDPAKEKKQLLGRWLHMGTQKLKVAFIYEKTPASSGWTYAHELGRLHLEQKFPEEVETVFYSNATIENVGELIEQAIEEGCKLIFTTAASLAQESVRLAIQYPEVRILNCSVNTSHRYIRTYYARMYEAKFLMGAIAGVMADNNKISYIADYPIYGTISNINAFALGVKMVNPRAKVYLDWSCLKDHDVLEEIRKIDPSCISGRDMTIPEETSRYFGIYHMENGCPRNLAMPLWHWGKFYELLIRTIMDGNWKSDDNSVVQKAINYWWGMSAGVVDVVCSRTLPNGTKRLIELLKENICEGTFHPFAGELYSQDGVLQSDSEEGLTPEEIVGMDWLVENVVGRIPTEEELVETAIPVVLQQGVEKKG